MFDGEGFSFPAFRWWEPGGGAGGVDLWLACGNGQPPFSAGHFRLPGRGPSRPRCGEVTQPAEAKSLGHRPGGPGLGPGVDITASAAAARAPEEQNSRS